MRANHGWPAGVAGLWLMTGLACAADPAGEAVIMPAVPAAQSPVETKRDDRNPDLLFHRSVYFSAKRGAAWLKSMQRPDGLFVYGWIPSLNRALPGENHLRQAGAAAALARAAAASVDREMALAARQAIVVLLSSFTEVDPADPERRRPTLPPADANPVGFAGLLLLAISELPEPTDALLDHGERLARFIAQRQRPDGSIDISASLEGDATDAPGGIDYYPGEALYGLLRSYANRPQPWKLEVVAKALPYYRQSFHQEPRMAFVPWQTAAMAEAYTITRKKEYADFAFEMVDFLRPMQYLDGSHASAGWVGGFASHEGRIVRTPPGITTACYAEALAEACRVAELQGDSDRLARTKSSLELALAFLMANQYSVNTATHFEKWYARKLNGAFHASVEDGTIRIDYAQHALFAMAQYLNHVARFENPDQEKMRLAPDSPRAN